jgi:integrase
MATFKYLTKGKGEFTTINFRLLDGRKTDITTTIGEVIKPEYWNSKKGEIKQNSLFDDKINLDNKLSELKTFIVNQFNIAKQEGLEISKSWLDEIINNYRNPINKTLTLIKAIEDYKEYLKIKVNSRTKKPVSVGTLRNFNTTISRLKKYQEFYKVQLSLLDIDLTFFAKYVKYAQNNLGLSTNSISKDLTQVKTVCLDAKDRGIEINYQVESRKFKLAQEKTIFTTITTDELERIRTFEGTNYLENARDWLIIGCWTGCRVNDLMKLSNDNLQVNTKGQRFIRYTQNKTGVQVDIAIHPHVQDILNKLGDFPRSISAERFNEYIKLVCKDDKVKMSFQIEGTRQNPESHKKETGKFEKWQLIRSHTCRRSFATNHYDKLPNKLIMKVTGHTTEKMLLAYIGETETEHLDNYIDLYNTVQENVNNKVKQINS